MARRRTNDLHPAVWLGIGVAAALYLIARATTRATAQAIGGATPPQLGSGT